MFIWLMWPAAKCSWAGFQNTNLPEVSHQNALDADTSEPDAETGFFARVYDSADACYSAYPISGQGKHKRNVLWGLLILAVVGWLVHRFSVGRNVNTGY